jgi:hypothetical protein
MLVFNLPKELAPRFVLHGGAVTVKINGVPRQLTFSREKEAVQFTDDEGPQSRKVIGVTEDGPLVFFTCTAADGSGVLIGPDDSGEIRTWDKDGPHD